ncbi:hypothetical protein Tco_0036372, partial [Tanacetum coccineum]
MYLILGSYKVVKVRYLSHDPSRTKGIYLGTKTKTEGVKGVKVRKGIMQTKTELTLEQTQQGVSDEVLETDIQKEIQKRPNQARDGKPKSIRSQ